MMIGVPKNEAGGTRVVPEIMSLDEFISDNGNFGMSAVYLQA